MEAAGNGIPMKDRNVGVLPNGRVRSARCWDQIGCPSIATSVARRGFFELADIEKNAREGIIVLARLRQLRGASNDSRSENEPVLTGAARTYHPS